MKEITTTIRCDICKTIADKTNIIPIFDVHKQEIGLYNEREDNDGNIEHADICLTCHSKLADLIKTLAKS